MAPLQLVLWLACALPRHSPLALQNNGIHSPSTLMMTRQHSNETTVGSPLANAIADSRVDLESLMFWSTELRQPNLSLSILAITMPKAREHIEAFLKNLGVETDAEIIPGVPRSSLNFDDLVASGKVSPQYLTVYHTPVAELATTFAHGRAVQHFLDSGNDYALIFEDDVVVNNKLLDPVLGVSGILQTLIANAPSDWDEINMGRCMDFCAPQRVKAILNDQLKLVQSHHAMCSSGYLLNRRGARKLDKMFRHGVEAANDVMKSHAFIAGEYSQYSLTPRLFQQSGRCGVNGCENQPECEPTNYHSYVKQHFGYDIPEGALEAEEIEALKNMFPLNVKVL
mmetsp:Transcript_13569/g.25869  ORF Transcript_13569/g.25869 Transcript_13569/m.25869 type:complete len:340 (-) Transcript_13569:35-1054(-)